MDDEKRYCADCGGEIMPEDDAIGAWCSWSCKAATYDRVDASCDDYSGPRGSEAADEMAHQMDQARRLK